METVISEALDRQNLWWFGKSFDTGVGRLGSFPLIGKYMGAREILVLLGARRVGKSTLMYQLIDKLLKEGVPPNRILLLNLDEPLFQSRRKDPAFLTGVVDEFLAKAGAGKAYVFIDEVQNNDYWAYAAKTLYDTSRDMKLVLTGSTSTLLKTQAAKRISGRYFQTCIYPLGFAEYLKFKGKENAPGIEKRQAFPDYLRFGGFPRAVLETDERLREETLKNYFETIYLRDIVEPNKVRNNRELYDLLFFLISNTAKLCSYQSLARAQNLTVKTVREYIGYMEDAYLLYAVNKYDPSVRKQQANQKKIYCADTGLINAVSFRFSENRGSMLENLVYMTYRRKGCEIYYHKGQFECDYLIRDKGQIVEASQACVDLADEKTRKREIRGIVEALKEHGLVEGTIITENMEETLTEDGCDIRIVPAHKWVLEEEGL